jgi:hypothetical protein
MRAIHGLGLAVFVAGCVALGQTQTEEKKADTATQASGSGPRSETPGVYRPEDGVVIPKVLYAPQPDFSDKARSKKLGGTCVLSMLVDAQGKPHEVQVVKSIAEGVKPKLRSCGTGPGRKCSESGATIPFSTGHHAGPAGALQNEDRSGVSHLLVLMSEQQTRQNNHQDQQDGQTGANRADEIAQGFHIRHQFGMFRGAALGGLAKKHDLIFDPLHLDGLALYLQAELTVAGLDFSQALLQFFMYGRLSRAAAVDEIEQLRKSLYGTVVDHAQSSGEDGQERLELAELLKHASAGLLSFAGR